MAVGNGLKQPPAAGQESSTGLGWRQALARREIASAPRRMVRTLTLTLAILTFVVVLGHLLALEWLVRLAPGLSGLQALPEPLFTRVLAPSEKDPEVVAVPPATPAPAPVKPEASLVAAAPASPASAPVPVAAPAPTPEPTPELAPAPPQASEPPPTEVATATPPPAEPAPQAITKLAIAVETPAQTPAQAPAQTPTQTAASEASVNPQAVVTAPIAVASATAMASTAPVAPVAPATPIAPPVKIESGPPVTARAPAAQGGDGGSSAGGRTAANNVQAGTSATGSAAADGPVAGGVPLERLWPVDTRITYKLSGLFRGGPLHGTAKVQWLRQGDLYQARVELSVSPFFNAAYTSQGQVTLQGLIPQAFEDTRGSRRRLTRFTEKEVIQHDGRSFERPAGVQDLASQFIEIGHRLRTGQVTAAPGSTLTLPLVRPGSVDNWTYDIFAHEMLRTPRLGNLDTVRVTPRPFTNTRGTLASEVWFAPRLQYLPVRLKISFGEEAWADLLVETIEQR